MSRRGNLEDSVGADGPLDETLAQEAYHAARRDAALLNRGPSVREVRSNLRKADGDVGHVDAVILRRDCTKEWHKG